MQRRQGFTLIELLVVISIIGLLISILLPAMNGARLAAISSTCLSQLRSVYQASTNYAADYIGEFPYDPDREDALHRMTSGDYDLNGEFIVPYLGGTRDKIMFCPGEVAKVRNPSHPQYVVNHVTYQYFNVGPGAAAKWLVASSPNLRSLDGTRGAPLWSDLAIRTSSNTWLAHDRALTGGTPELMNVTFLDGSGEALSWSADIVELYLDSSNRFHGPVWPGL